MEAFYVCIIFLGIILVIVSLFLILMDRVNGKDFFKEFDRKKDEMFSLIQDSEEMVQELNNISDYVITVISEKNKEFKGTNFNMNGAVTNIDKNSVQDSKELQELNEVNNQVQEEKIIPSTENSNTSEMFDVTTYPNNETNTQKLVDTQFFYSSEINKDSSNMGKSKLVLNSRRREVLKMIEQGLSNDEISDKLKIGKGEIGLIRGLSR